MNKTNQEYDLPATVIVEKELEPLMSDFYEGRKDDIEALKEAIENNNWHEIERRGHILGGVCGTYGFGKLGELGDFLENSARPENKNEIITIINTIEKYMSNVSVVFK